MDGLHDLEIDNCFTIPDFKTLRTDRLSLCSIPDLTDLSFFDEMEPCVFRSVELIGLDELTSLEPLRRFSGEHLTVPPQLAEQAAILVEDGLFGEYDVEYPQGGWSLEQMDFMLQSFEELETMPKAMLRHVTRVCVAGDRIVDTDRFDICEDWEHTDRNGNPALLLFDRETGEETKLQKGVITDLSVFSELTGLRFLCLYAQPIQSLDGVQRFTELEEFDARRCAELRDASALFAVQSLQRIDLGNSPVSSIQGIQNLSELRQLDLSNTAVEDLTPLAGCDFSAAERDGGLDLCINQMPPSAYDFTVIGSIRRYSNIAFDGQDPEVWIPALADCEIAYMAAGGDLCGNGDLEAFVAGHPELRGIYIGYNRKITDLRCLLSLGGLEWVCLNKNMSEAVASLDGADYSFELELEG